MGRSDNGDDDGNRPPATQRPLRCEGEAVVANAGRRISLQAFFDKPSGNPYARAQEADERDARPYDAANSECGTSRRERSDQRPLPFHGDAVSSNVGRRAYLQALFDKAPGNPYARAQEPEDHEVQPLTPTQTVSGMQSASKHEISRDRETLQNPYAHLSGEGNFRALTNEPRPRPSTSMPRLPTPISIDPEQLFHNRSQRQRYRNPEIENAARALQKILWRNRKTIFAGRETSDPMEFLDPSLAIRCLGMSFDVCESLGQYSDSNGRFEVAGQIDPQSRQVRVSRQFLPHIQKFTAAHELGHAVLHGGSALHRDRALDGPGKTGIRDRREIEADKFAAAFLMPAKPLGLQFASRFHTTKLILDDDTAFGIASQNQDSLRTSVRDLRDWSRMVAGASFYQGQHFVSLAEQFGVSVATMAIRLEELDLIGL